MRTEDKFKQILSAVPTAGGTVNWDLLWESALCDLFSDMKATEQEPEYHGEGNVYNHTKLVTEAMIGLPIYRESDERDRTVLFLSALLHDIGKIRCTRREGGRITSPHHAATGARMAREFMFRELGMSGNDDARSLREAVCGIIRYHSFPPFAIKSPDAELKLLKIAANGELTSDFSIRKLCVLEMADAIGRVGTSTDDYLERTEYC